MRARPFRNVAPYRSECKADFGGEFYDIRDAPGFEACLSPTSYIESQSVAERLLAAGSAGILYPSARHPGGTCLACFRPALVGHVRKDARWRFTWDGSSELRIELEASYPEQTGLTGASDVRRSVPC